MWYDNVRRSQTTGPLHSVALPDGLTFGPQYSNSLRCYEKYILIRVNLVLNGDDKVQVRSTRPLALLPQLPSWNNPTFGRFEGCHQCSAPESDNSSKLKANQNLFEEEREREASNYQREGSCHQNGARDPTYFPLDRNVGVYFGVALESVVSGKNKELPTLNNHRDDNGGSSNLGRDIKAYVKGHPDLKFNEKVELITNRDPGSDLNSANIRNIMFAYFFDPERLSVDVALSPRELAVVKVMITKKLVHDKKKSHVNYAIKNLNLENLATFCNSHPAVNRKNIIKSNIFKKVWKILESKHQSDFATHFFGHLAEAFPENAFSIRHFRKEHCFNLSDKFYKHCLQSFIFRKELFEIVNSPLFTDNLLKHSKQKFLNCFDFWVSESARYLAKNNSCWDGKLPDFKYGLSVKDLEIVGELFQKLLPRGTVHI
jgi:hypothetical protein